MNDLLPLRKVRADKVRVGERHRKDMGDLAPLADSLRAVGLLHPIVVTSDLWLVVGERRLRAARDVLGWETIPAFVMDVDSLRAEHDENEVRKEFNTSERVAIAKALVRQMGERRGRPAAGAGEIPQKFAEFAARPGTETREMAAKAAGFGNHETLRQAQSVLKTGDPALVEAMDAGRISVHAAADAARLPPAQQQEVAADVKAGKKPRRAVRDAKKKAEEGKGRGKKAPQKQEEVRDRLGKVVPPSLRDVFADRRLPDALDRVKAWIEQVKPDSVAKAFELVAAAYPWIDAAKFREHLKEALAELQAAESYARQNLPHAVCPECDGRGSIEGEGRCEGCRNGCGYVPLWRLAELKLERRA